VHSTLESSDAIQRGTARSVNVQSFSHLNGIHHGRDIHGTCPSVVEETQTSMGGADGHWNVLAIAISLALALGAMLSVASSVAATRMDPAAVAAATPPTAPGLDPGPL
jgi:hypothetical protein